MTPILNVAQTRQTITKIGFIALQSNKHHLLLFLLLFSGITSMFGQENKVVILPIKSIQDSIVAPKDFSEIATKPEIEADTVKVDSTNKKKPLLLDNIKYSARDYVKLSQKDSIPRHRA